MVSLEVDWDEALGAYHRIPMRHDAKCETKILYCYSFTHQIFIKTCFMLALMLGTEKILVHKIQVNYI